MGSQKLASKVIINEEDPRIRSIAGVDTARLGAVMLCERGPIGVATLTTSYEEWARVFGGFIANGNGAIIAQAFYENGGQFLHTVRTVHYSDPATPSSKTSAPGTVTLLTEALAAAAGTVLGTVIGPFVLAHGVTLVGQVDGAGSQTATISAVASSRESAAETWDFTGGKTLTVSINGGATQTITFVDGNFADPANATAEEVAAVINAGISGASASVTSGGTKVTITTDRKGTGASVNVIGGTANALLAFTTGALAGTGNVANVEAVTVSEIKTIVEAAWTNGSGVTVSNDGGAVRITSNTTGVSSSILVVGSSTADDELGLDNATHTGTDAGAVDTLQVDGKTDGAYANDIEVKTTAATNGDSAHFNLVVLDGGLQVEVWPNLSLDPSAVDYVETVINDEDTGSNLIAVTDLLAAVDSPDNIPALGTFGPMTGGDDGLTSIGDNDFIGSAVPSAKTGIRALDLVENLSLLAVPDRATAAVHAAMITYADTTREKSIVAILDPPANLAATAVITYVKSTAAIQELSEHGIFYWPRVTIPNPAKAVFGATVKSVTVPPSGHIAGVYARTDNAPGGIYQPPAGASRGILLGVNGFETDECLDQDKRDLVYPERINPLTTKPGLPRFIDGTRTLKSTGNFPTIAERRGVIFIEQSVKRALEFARHENNTEGLRAGVDRSVTSFLVTQMKLGAFRTKDPKTAFFVDFGEGLNPPSVVFAGILRGRIGLATNKPADFIELNFSQDTRALEAELSNS